MKIVKLKQISLLTVSLVVMSSCYNLRHIPSMNNTNFFEEKGEAKVELGIIAQPEINGAYAVTEHFSVQASFSFGQLKAQKFRLDSTYSKGGEAQIIRNKAKGSFGVGYQGKLSEKLIFETYGGAEYSTTNPFKRIYYEDGTIVNEPLNDIPPYQAIYLQPAIGYNGKHFKWGYSHRISVLMFNGPDWFGTLMEPSLFIGFGGQRTKCNLYLTVPIINDNNKIQPRVFYGGIGISYNFRQLK